MVLVPELAEADVACVPEPEPVPAPESTKSLERASDDCVCAQGATTTPNDGGISTIEFSLSIGAMALTTVPAPMRLVLHVCFEAVGAPAKATINKKTSGSANNKLTKQECANKSI